MLLNFGMLNQEVQHLLQIQHARFGVVVTLVVGVVAINFGLNYPLTKVFLKTFLHIGVTVCVIISICQWLMRSMRLLIVISSSSLSSR